MCPELNYDLTCQLGQLLSTSEKQLLTVKNLSELNRLPWFISGQIPQSARALLLEYLERENPTLLQKVRGFLHAVMQQNAPSPDSVAATDYAMQMALNEWLFTRNSARKRALEKEIAKLLEAGVEDDLRQINSLIIHSRDTWRYSFRATGVCRGFSSCQRGTCRTR